MLARISRAGVWRLASQRTMSSQASGETEVEQRLDEHGVFHVVLNRPKARNALSASLLSKLQAAVRQAHFDPSVRALILSSSASVFCAGADLKERAAMAPPEVAEFVHLLRSTFTQLAELPVPTIAVVSGAAVGGGCELAIACDLRVADSNARFALPETNLAIIPGAGGTQRLPRLVGLSRAKEMTFTGRTVQVKEAQAIGLVDRVPNEDLGETALGVAEDLAMTIARKGPVATRMAKVAINRGIETDLASGLAIEQLCYAQVIPTKDRLEGLASFREKRQPVYTGE